MSLLLDERESIDLRRYLSSYDLSVSICHLDYGDACFEGLGPNNSPVLIGIERKRLPDLVSSIESRRLAGHQLLGMYQTYDYRYLVVEGFWRPSPTGSIEVFEGSSWRPLFHERKSILYRQVDSYLDSLSTSEPIVTVCRTVSTSETAALYASRYLHWQKPWTSRHSRDAIYAPPPPAPGTKVSFREPNLIHRILAQFPGIDARAWAIGDKFRTPDEFFRFVTFADEKDWSELPGVGKTGAQKVVDVLAGKKR